MYEVNLRNQRVRWCGHIWGDDGLHVEIVIGGQNRLVSRRLAEQIRDELTQVLEQHPDTDGRVKAAKAGKDGEG